MSADARGGEEPPLTEIDDYDAMLDRLETLIEEGTEKIESGRVYDEKKERVRQGWHRVVVDSIDAWRKLRSDRDLEELRLEVEELKAGRE